MSKMVTFAVASAGFALLAYAPYALCAEPTTATGSEQAGAPLELKEVVVTAERQKSNLERTPLSVVAISANDLRKQAINSDADLQFAVPGLTIRATSGSNQLSYSIRGQSVDAFSNSPPAVLQYFNDVEITPNSAIPFYDLQSIQVLKGPQGTLFGRNTTGGAVLFTPEKPTNHFGGYITASAGNYQSQNYVAAINLPIVPDRVLFRLAGTYQYHQGYAYNLFTHSRLGQVNRQGVRASLIVRLTDSITNYLVLDYAHSSGSNEPNVAYSAYAPGSTNNGYALDSLASTLFSPGLDAAIGVPGAWAGYLAAHPGAYPGGLVAFTALQNSRGPFLTDVNSYLAHSAESTILTNTTTFELANDLTLKNIFGYTYSRSLDVYDYDGTPYQIEGLGAPGEPTHGYSIKDRAYSEELQLQGKADDSRLNYTAGLYFSHERAPQGDGVYFFELLPYIPATQETLTTVQTNTSYAAYAQATYDLSKVTGIHGLGVTAGVRDTEARAGSKQLPGNAEYGVPGTQLSLTNNTNKPSYLLGLQEQLSPSWLLYVLTRESFRGGGVNSTAPQRPMSAAAGGALFGPETTRDVEVGSKWQGRLGDMPARLNLDVYDQWVNNVQRTIYATVPLFGLSSLTVNVPRANMTGLELDSDILPTSWLKIGANVAYDDARFTNNKVVVFGQVERFGPFPDTPHWTGTVYAQLAVPSRVGTVTLRGDLYAQSLTYFSSTNATITPGTEIHGYAIANFRLGLEHVDNSNLSLAISVQNAFNRVYYVGGLAVGAIESVNEAAPGAPRTFFAEAHYTF